MVAPSKFAEFVEKAKQNVDQINIGLLRHDKNPKDREFLNDISKSLRSIKNSALPLRLPRITELCHNLETLTNLIREEKKELNQEIIITITSCRDRLTKFLFELETANTERSKVKDLVTRIQNHITEFEKEEAAGPEPEVAAAGKKREKTGKSAGPEAQESSLLPEEIVKKEYDKELFQIFIEQLQENLSLLRSHTDEYDKAENKENVINRCSNLVGKLQSSANYMGYEELANFYLQWIAELEMAGVELSMGTQVSFAFMDGRIKKVAGLFPEIKDKPADSAALEKQKKAAARPAPEPEPEKEKDITEDEEFREMFGSLDEIENEEFDEDMEPIAALSGVTAFEEEEPASAGEEQKPAQPRKQARAKKTIEIDGSFLEEERESESYDEELFQIFVQQLQENISQLQKLTDSFSSEANKSNIINKCSNLVGKLQASANYMGYERLAEFYLQWIAELEMTGVEHSLGSDISFGFMQEKIDRINALFPAGGGAPAAEKPKKTDAEKAPPPSPVKEVPPPAVKKAELPSEEEESQFPLLDQFAEEEEEEEEEPLSEGVVPIAGVFEEEHAESEDTEASFFAEGREAELVTEEAAEFMDALDEKLQSFFADLEEPETDEDLETSFMAIASLSDDEEEEEEEPTVLAAISPIPEDTMEDLFISEEEKNNLAAEFEPIAGVFEEETTAPAEEEPVTEEPGEFGEAVEEKLESLFAGLEEPESEEDLETSFMEVAESGEKEKEQAPAGETAPALAGAVEDLFEEEEEEEEEEPLAEGVEPIAGLFEEEAGAPEEEVVTEETGDFGEAVEDKLESFFADLEEPEEEEELETSFMEVAALGEEEEEKAPAGETVPASAGQMEELFAEAEEEVEEPLAEGVEPIAGLFEEEAGAPEKEVVTEEQGEFGEEVEDKLESFFADLEEPEGEEELETSFLEVAALGEEEEEPAPAGESAPAPAREMEELFEEEPAEPEEEVVTEEQGEFGEEIEDKLESFFADLEEPEETTPAGEEMAADIESPAEEGLPEAAEHIAEPAVDIEKLMAAEELPGEEEIEFMEPVAEDEFEEEEVVREDFLSDEELLREIEGPTVGEEITAEQESLIPDIEKVEEAVSALPEEELSEEELFEKLESAISAKEQEAERPEELIHDDELFEEEEIGEPALETPPERRELFQKLTHALQSLEEEAGEMEAPEEVGKAEPQPEMEFDSQLFDRLVSALERPSEKVEITGARPMDKVLEEILSTRPVEPGHVEPAVESADHMPRRLAASEIKQIIRMDTDKVDLLMNQVGELHSSRSTLSKLFAEMNDLHQHYLEMEGFNKQELKPFKDLIFRLGDTSVSLSRLSSELREGILKVRMVPISLLFDRYDQFVADLAAGSGKQVAIEINGEDTELEKMVIDEISEPLTHIISNAVEHGIETMDERRKLGKDETGKIRLDAYQENNEIVIEVMDDGCGIDLKKVKARALEMKLFSGDELFRMSERDLSRLILNPAFSTVVDKGRKPADRGEGLRIVKDNIDQLKGSIDIRSRTGKGTIIQIRVPLNLLVIKALKVRAGKEVMALPVNYIEEIKRVNKNSILTEDGGTFFRINEMTLPVFRLSEVFNIEPAESEEERLTIVIVEAERQAIGLIVDTTEGLEEIVIKPIGEFLRKESGFSGATIISDGNISLVPDIAQLIRIAKKRQPVPEESMA